MSDYRLRQTGKPLPTTQLTLKETKTSTKYATNCAIGIPPLILLQINNAKADTVRKIIIQSVSVKCMDSNHVGSAPP